jgi:hypothetical protein
MGKETTYVYGICDVETFLLMVPLLEEMAKTVRAAVL